MIRIALLAASMLAAAAAPAGAQTLTARVVSDPQAYVAEQTRACEQDAGKCLRATFLSAFGDAVLQNQELAASQKAFETYKAVEWSIIADTELGGSQRWIHVLMTLNDESALGLRYEFRYWGGQWRLTDLTFNTTMRELFTPMPPAAKAVPITNGPRRAR